MTDAEIKDYILKNFSYNNGAITRKDMKGGLGSLDKDGYLILKVKGRQFKAHRVAWLLCYGDFPKCEIDHINRIRTDNRIENLRESNRKEQVANTEHKPNAKTGVCGVYYDETTVGLKAKYTTRINGKAYRFRTLDEAIKLRKDNGLWV